MKPQIVKAQVERVTPLTDSILQLILDPEEFVDYKPGQYLQIKFGEDFYSYSIANAPLGSKKYELHIRHTQDNPYTQALFKEIKASGQVTLSLPAGDCHLEALHPQKPILFIAGGTGFAPIKAMIEQLLTNGERKPFELFWGARSRSDLYLEDMVNQWAKHVQHFQYHSLVSNISKEPLGSFVITHHPQDIAEWQIVISGPFDMVFNIRDILLEVGVPQKHLYSDAFNFEGSR